MRGKWSFSLETELEMADDLIDGLSVFDKGDTTHLTSAESRGGSCIIQNFSFLPGSSQIGLD
ncbi:MAG: hypothetical protein GTO16_00170 [Candidatus Aminicenantes bacterium]|nr:hypothetical protein [Candidatus Aminicenantes bacterium]